MAKINNLKKTDLKQTLKRLKKDSKNFSSLIVRDIFDHLDFLVEIDRNLNDLIFNITNEKYHPQQPYFHFSPKSKGINRPTVVLSIEDSIVYRFCIESIQQQLLDETRQENVRGGIHIKAQTDEFGDTYYEKYFKDWMEHNESVYRNLLEKPGNYLVTTDIASYFENINTQILKDLTRDTISNQTGCLNLLFYFLEATHKRNNYEVNTNNGLLQEDIDCSRTLAYFFLSPHDEAMCDFCVQKEASYFRYVDDMNIVVDSENKGRQALKVLTESLRKLGLISSIEKTEIIPADEAIEQMLWKENSDITEFERGLIENKDNLGVLSLKKQEFVAYYRQTKTQKGHYKTWRKVLSRFYSIFSIFGVSALNDDLPRHLIDFPTLFVGNKLQKYLVGINKSSDYFSVIEELVAYLKSEENLYASLESSIVEALINLDINTLNQPLTAKLGQVGEDIFFRKDYAPNSEYVRGLGTLLIYKYKKQSVEKLATHYLNSNENDEYVRKYLIATSLTTSNHTQRKKVLEKAKREQNGSINRLLSLVENIDEYKNNESFKKYLKEKELFIGYKPEFNFKKTTKYLDTRSQLLKEITNIYSATSSN